MKTAIISGTFDPITIGHMDIINRASALFDKVVVAISENAKKDCILPDDVRVASIRAAVEHIPNTTVAKCEGLLAEFCGRYENPIIVRGVRTGSEFDYERSLFVINKSLGAPETIVFPAESGMDHISSTYVRELIKYNKSLKGVIPDGALAVIEAYLNK